jgi:hypothetical protein
LTVEDRQRGAAVTYRIRLLVPSTYTDEARIMIEEHPRAVVVEIHDCPNEPAADVLVVVSSEPRILRGLHRWWMDRRVERRAQPPMALVRPDDTLLTFNDHSPETLEEIGRQDQLLEAS